MADEKKPTTNPEAEQTEHVPLWTELSQEIQRELELTGEEERVLNDAQQRARLFVAFGRSLKETAKELEGTEGAIGCSYSYLRKLSARFGWTDLKKRIDDQRSRTTADILSERAAVETVSRADEIEIPAIDETPEEIKAKHFHVATQLLAAVDRSLKRYKDGLPQEKEIVEETESAKRDDQSQSGKSNRKAKGALAKLKKRSKQKGIESHNVPNLRSLANVAETAERMRLRASGLDRTDDEAAGIRSLVDIFDGMTEEELDEFILEDKLPN